MSTLASFCSSLGGRLRSRPSPLLSQPCHPFVAVPNRFSAMSSVTEDQVVSGGNEDSGTIDWLVVGDGDLSYSSVMAEELGQKSNVNLIAESLAE